MMHTTDTTGSHKATTDILLCTHMRHMGMVIMMNLNLNLNHMVKIMDHTIHTIHIHIKRSRESKIQGQKVGKIPRKDKDNSKIVMIHTIQKMIHLMKMNSMTLSIRLKKKMRKFQTVVKDIISELTVDTELILIMQNPCMIYMDDRSMIDMDNLGSIDMDQSHSMIDMNSHTTQRSTLIIIHTRMTYMLH